MCSKKCSKAGISSLVLQLGEVSMQPSPKRADILRVTRVLFAAEPQYHSGTKHMDIQRKWQGEIQETGTVELRYVPTAEQIADGFIKPLARDRFEWFRRGL